MRSQRGSLWSKWDLHVHTPATLANNTYGGSTDPAWERFFSDIEALPKEFKVIGINDYLFLDGYRRVLDGQAQGRLRNIELILPVVELRLSAFGGTKNKLSRVNFHVIFSDELGPDLIEAQFLNGLTRHYRVTPAYQHLEKEWRALPTRESLEELGKMIINEVPEEERHRFGSNLEVGFNNLNFELASVEEVLQSHYFRDRHLKGVGKTEWWDIKWTDNTIADKKNIVSRVDFVFIAAEDAPAWERAQRALVDARVNGRLLDCSDAHAFSDSENKDRIGNCSTWIKADTTFEGLGLALKEFEERVFVGTEPAVRRRVREHPSRYVNRVEVRRVAGATTQEVWFNNQVELNPGLVAIIGNKGNGKSALAETIALVGNTRQQDHFSFLSGTKFRQRASNKASQFEGVVTWQDGSVSTRRLDAGPDAEQPERVQFIPQNFLEKICNEVPRGEASEFDRELSRVIFAHVDRTERLGQNTLEDLLAARTRAADAALQELRRELHEINGQIVALETQAGETHRKHLQTQFIERRRALRDLKQARPAPVPEPAGHGGSPEAAAALDANSATHQALVEEAEAAERDLDRVNQALAAVDNFTTALDTFERSAYRLREEYAGVLLSVGIDFGHVVQLTLDRPVLQDARTHLASERVAHQQKLDPEHPNSVPARLAVVRNEMERLQAELDAPQRAYRVYLADLEEWHRRRAELLGAAHEPGTVLFFRAQRHALRTIPESLERLREQRRERALRIHHRLVALVEEYRTLYRPIQRFIDEQAVSADVDLRFSASLVDRSFEPEFLEYIDRRVATSFAGPADGEGSLRDLLTRQDLNDSERAVEFATAVHNKLRSDARNPESPGAEVQGLLRKGKSVQEVYDFVFGFSYLEPRYTLQFGDKPLHELSPGEKGTLLLIFYLLVDPNEAPLVIDQPEDNLDNQTVYRVLVPSIREARKRRQIFLVTHNPNLAVVCDADQVIAAAIEKEHGNRVLYDAGAMENPAINRRVVDVLEGTRPAFDNRGSKYQRQGE